MHTARALSLIIQRGIWLTDAIYLQPGLNQLKEAKFCVVRSERKHLKTLAITMLMPFTYLCLGFTSEIHFSLWAGLSFSVVQSLALEGNFVRVIVATSHGEG